MGRFPSGVSSFLVAMALLLAGSSFGSEMHEHHEGHGGEPMLTKHHEDSLFLVTEKKLFGVEMLVPDAELKMGVNTVDIIVHDQKDRDVDGADITVTPWMPDMGHGVHEKPEVTEKGSGLYTVGNILVIMAGNWQLKVTVRKGNVEDTAVFNFPGMKARAPQEYVKHTTPAGYEVIIGRDNPLPELTPELITEKGKKIKVFRLTVEDAAMEVYPGTFFEGWGFNGSIPGPTIRVTEGDRIRVILTNKTKDFHTLHVHGQRKPVVMDGVPYVGQAPVGPDESYTYEFTVETPGTSWYHCHVDSAHHVDMGMYGAFIVEPKREKLKYDREYVLVLDEFPTGHVHVHHEAGDTEMEGHEEHGVVTEHKGEPVHEHPGEKKKRDWYPETYNPYTPLFNAFTINGKSFPYTQPLDVREGERVRIRLINVGYEPHYIHTHAHKFLVTHRDGLPLREQFKLDTVEVGPGQRVDILLIADNPGVWPIHCHRLNHVANDNVYPGGMMGHIRYID
jgi:FtsP/CotA-like multicopper oxidase with cupredoxin domain